LSFCAGADLRADPPPGHLPHGAHPRARRHFIQIGRRAIRAIEDLDAITIAAVHGHAAGGGFGVMEACDLRVVCADARLWLPEVDVGVPLTWGLTAALTRDVGRAKAMELIALCDNLPAEDALRLGLVNKVVSGRNELDLTVAAMATRLARKSPLVLQLVKTQFRALRPCNNAGDVTVYDNDLLLYTGLLEQGSRHRNARVGRDAARVSKL
jgi:enoyl-CoA hydratase/carnithine racemase